MLTPEEDMEISSLRKRGWSISAIARHTGRDRKTVRAYLSGDRELGARRRGEPDPNGLSMQADDGIAGGSRLDAKLCRFTSVTDAFAETVSGRSGFSPSKLSWR